jgi:arylsulfatase B
MRRFGLENLTRATKLFGVAGACVMALVCQSTARAAEQPSGERNILLIIADDIGVDMVGQPYVDYYNFTKRTDDDIIAPAVGVPKTPTISNLKKSGVTFLNHWATPTCSPTRASIFTGMYANRHTITHPSLNENFTERKFTTIADELTIAHYETGLFGKWHLGQEDVHRPTDNGWGLHQGFLGAAVRSYSDWDRVDSDVGDESERYTEYAPKQTVTDALNWITKRKGRWMATVAFNAAHTPDDSPFDSSELPPPDCASCFTPNPKVETEIFRATVEYMDCQIERLLRGIPSDALDVTTIIFVCDNGTQSTFSEHFNADACKESLHEGGINTALIIADGATYRNRSSTGGVGRIVKPNRISKALVNCVDLFATIADIAGAAKKTAVDSISLVPLLENSKAKVRDWNFVYATLVDGSAGWAVRGTQYKLIKQYDGTTQQLYHLVGDRWEGIDLSGKYDHIQSQLETQASSYLK